LTLLSNPLTGMVQSGFKATGTQFRVRVTGSLSCRFSSRQVQVPSDLIDEKESVGPAPCVVTVSTACHAVVQYRGVRITVETKRPRAAPGIQVGRY
jgi:hypothetical protein